jgi:hypothetical protein
VLTRIAGLLDEVCVMSLLTDQLVSISQARINMLRNRLWIGLAILILVVLPSWSFGQAKTPCLFSPSGIGTDDSQALAALLRACGWVQIDGPDIQINQPIVLVDEEGQPLHFATVEPVPGLSKVTVHTTIDRDPNAITNPSRAPFDYHGNFQPGSYLRLPTPVGQSFIVIHDPATLSTQPFDVGDYVYINDTSSNPQTSLSPKDGAVEVRQIVSSAVGPAPNTIRLDLDRPLHRPHGANIIVAHCQPINYVSFRNLEFTTDYDPQASNNPRPRVGIHLHMAYRATISGITSTKWAGFALVLLDTGGRENIVRDVYATGAALYEPHGNGWGIALEGQENSTILDCGAEGFLEGIVINYSYNTIASGSIVRSGNFGLRVHSDIGNHGSIRSGFVGGSVTGVAIGAAVGPYCQECIVDVDISANYIGIWIFQFAKNTTIGGSIHKFSTFGIGFDLINGGIADGALTSRQTYVYGSVTCNRNNRLALTKGGRVISYPSSLEQLPWLVLGSVFNQCP